MPRRLDIGIRARNTGVHLRSKPPNGKSNTAMLYAQGSENFKRLIVVSSHLVLGRTTFQSLLGPLRMRFCRNIFNTNLPAPSIKIVFGLRGSVRSILDQWVVYSLKTLTTLPSA